ncbi:DUF6531 domain-containing protein [[Kitasatospora] papulosa]|uniref:DUF6531 domain-containing protein n=1 Tax=[Kitasatospora] papulosa TaxID=1464011 RepID=UPI0036D02EA4
MSASVIDMGPQEVRTKVKWGCFVNADSAVDGTKIMESEPKSVVAPWFGKEATAAVSFSVTFDEKMCEADIRRNEALGVPEPYTHPTTWIVSASYEEHGEGGTPIGYPGFGVGGIWGYTLSALPLNQTFGSGCESNSASAATCSARSGVGVNTATGAFTQGVTDIGLSGEFSPSFDRSYSSNNSASGSFGPGWASNFDARLRIQDDGSILFHGEDGSIYPFTKNSTGGFVGPLTAHSSLSAIGSGYRLKTQSGETVEFDSSGLILNRKSPQGSTISYGYEAGKLKAVTGPNGRSATLTYNGSLLSSITTSDGRLVSYGFEGGRLTSFTNVDGATVTYNYDSAGRLAGIIDQLENPVVQNTFDTENRVVEQKRGSDKVSTTFSYHGNETDVIAPDGGVWTDVHIKNVLVAQYDPFGNKTAYEYNYKLDSVAVSDARGNRYETWIDSKGRMTRQRSPERDEGWDYNSAGNLAGHFTSRGSSRYKYDSSRRIIEATDPEQNVTRYTYTPAGLVESVTLPSGQKTFYGYDALGNQVSVTDGSGFTETRTFDSAGRVRTVTDPRGNVDGANAVDFTSEFTYDKAGRVLTEEDCFGNIVVTNTYDKTGNLKTVTDGASNVTIYTYDSSNRLIETRDPSGNPTKVAYDSAGNIASRTDANEAMTTYTYDKAGRMATMTTPRGNAAGANSASFTWKYGYDKVGNQTHATDPISKTTLTEYDTENRPVKVTDPLNHSTKTAYDSEGNVHTRTDALDRTTTSAYDRNNRLTSVTSPASKTINYAYDADGNLISETTPLGHKTTYAYDDSGRLTDRVDPRGNVTGADPAAYTWHTGYDVAGNVTSQKDPLGNSTTSKYDGANNLVETTDPRGKKTIYAYDSLHRLQKVTAPDNGTTLLEYNKAGLIAKRTNAKQHALIYQYDKVGRLTKTADPLDRATSYEYDADGNRTKVTNARTQTITTTYDGRNLPGTITYSDGTPKVTYTYYDDSSPKTIADGTGTRTLTYDAVQRPLTITQPGVATPFKYTYNPNGTIASRTYPSGRATTYQYDDDARVVGQTTNAKTTMYGWDAANNLVSTKLPTTTVRAESRTYDQAGRIATASEGAGAHHFERDRTGRIISDTYKDLTTTRPATRYAYDDAGRLTRACTDTTTSCLSGTTGETYTYDEVGNRKSVVSAAGTTTNTYDAADQLTQSITGTTSSALTYDADGNLTKDATGSYTYTAAGQTKTATVGANTYAFGYDADGNRTTASINGTASRITTWDVNNLLPQIATDRSATNVLVGDYQYNPLGSAQQMDTPKGSFYLQHDRQGSITNIYDAAGAETYKYTYGPWGATTGTASTTGGQKSLFGFTGEYKDPYVPNQVDLRARTYSSVTGRFTTPDPETTQPGSTNSSPYAYANNDPINQSDPSGRCPLCVSAGIGAIIGGAVEGGFYGWQHRNDAEFSWQGLAGATAEGAATGALAGLLMPGVGNAVTRGLGLSGVRGIATSTAVNAGVGAGFSWAVNEANCRPTDPWDLAVGAAGGGASSLAGPAFAWLKGRMSAGNPPARFGPGAAHAEDPAMRGAGGFNVASITEEPGFQYLYRGLSVMHPGYDDAVRGAAAPRGGPASMESHHMGNTQSNYTSWDTSRETALRYARGAAIGRKDLPGVIIQVKLPLGQPVYPSIMFSSNLWEGTEHLVEGGVTGARVWHIPAP